MRSAISNKQLVLRKRLLFTSCLLLIAYCLSACSIPNLEKPECAGARDVVKRFYSFHFGNDMRPSAENLKRRQAYLTPELFKELSAKPETKQDYFTATEDYPRAFRVGACKDASADRVTMQVDRKSVV